MIPTFPEDRSVFRIEDAYKLIHQAYLGPGHAIPSHQEAEKSLREEWAGLGEGRTGELLIEVLVVGAPFVRVHLRPYRDAGGDLSVLLSQFLRSANTPADLDRFLAAWESLGIAIRSGESPFEIADYRELDRWAREGRYPAIHHSGAFAGRWNPAYRVLAVAETQKLRRGLKG